MDESQALEKVQEVIDEVSRDFRLEEYISFLEILKQEIEERIYAAQSDEEDFDEESDDID